MIETLNPWNEFDTKNHLQPEMDTAEFDSLHQWDFGWKLLEGLNNATSDEHEIELSKRFSPGQKALYFFWYLDEQVTNGGFIQFYWNEYGKYLPAIDNGLNLMGDKKMLLLIEEVNEYLADNLSTFQNAIDKEDFEGIFETLPKFDEFDERYFELNNQTLELIENMLEPTHPNLCN